MRLSGAESSFPMNYFFLDIFSQRLLQRFILRRSVYGLESRRVCSYLWGHCTARSGSMRPMAIALSRCAITAYLAGLAVLALLPIDLRTVLALSRRDASPVCLRFNERP